MHALGNSASIARRELEVTSGSNAAPHVAGLLHRIFGDGAERAAQILAGLAPAQLTGSEMLARTAISAAARLVDLGALTRSERRVLVFAAHLVVDRAAVLIDATAVPTAVLLSERVRSHLVLLDGRARFLDPVVRDAILATAPGDERAAAHDALARAARAHGHSTAATWHAANADWAAAARAAPGLLEVAEQQAYSGGLDLAARIAQGATSEVPAQRATAKLLAARAALFSGHPGTARRLLERRSASTVLEFDGPRHAILRIARALDPSPMPQAARRPTSTEDPATATAAKFRALSTLALRHIDRIILTQLALTTERWSIDPDEADESLARLAVSVPLAHTEPNYDDDAASPLVEAHLRLMQSRFLLHSGDRDAAAAVFLDGYGRLPFSIADPVMAHELAHVLVGAAPRERARVTDFHPSPIPPRRGHGQSLMDAARLLFATETSHPDIDGWTLLLSRRERHVAELIADGLRNREIGERLGISERTVEVHLGKIYRKAGVTARGGLIAKLLR